jgi:hypothetical protein
MVRRNDFVVYFLCYDIFESESRAGPLKSWNGSMIVYIIRQGGFRPFDGRGVIPSTVDVFESADGAEARVLFSLLLGRWWFTPSVFSWTRRSDYCAW